jgi:putative ABC transport system permease protein
LNELHVVAEYADDAEQVLLTINRVKASLEEDGFTIPMSLAAEPGTVPLEDILQAVLLLLGVLGVLSLLLSAFLIVNTVSALMAQQIRQIGILKVVGARSSQIVGMYLVLVLTYGALALALAVPLGVVGARALSQTMAGAFNFDLTQFRIPILAIGLQIATGLIVPPLTALYPVLAGLRVTAAEAMRDHGMGQDRFGRGALDRLLTRQSHRRRRLLSRPLLLSLRNTFRRKGRLILTLTTLILGGAIFIGVFSVRSSLLRTLADVTEMYRSDVWIHLARPHPVAQVEQLATDVPGVVRARGWTRMPVRRVRPDGSEGDDLALCAPPVEADLLHPAILEGRWLLPGDRRALVLSSGALRSEPDLAVGDEIVLKIRGSEARFTVVGVSLGLGVAPYVYAEYGEVARLAQEGSEVSSLLLVTEEHDAAFQAEVAAALETRFREAGVRVNSVQLVSEENAGTETGLRIVILLALVMAVLLAIVGGLGLAGTLSINVLERTREIGVMRAIGASDGAVAQVFVAEGVLIGVISWLFATLSAIPLSSLLGEAVGRSFLQASLSYSFSVTGALLWLGVAIVLGALASFVPARSASRLTVREVLAYE